jgi:hypothetical protein
MFQCEPYAILVSSLDSAMVDTEVNSLCGVMGTKLHDWGRCCYMGRLRGATAVARAGVNACAGSIMAPRLPLGVRGVTGGGALSSKASSVQSLPYSICRLGWENLCVAWTWDAVGHADANRPVVDDAHQSMSKHPASRNISEKSSASIHHVSVPNKLGAPGA